MMQRLQQNVWHLSAGGRDILRAPSASSSHRPNSAREHVDAFRELPFDAHEGGQWSEPVRTVAARALMALGAVAERFAAAFPADPYAVDFSPPFAEIDGESLPALPPGEHFSLPPPAYAAWAPFGHTVLASDRVPPVLSSMQPKDILFYALEKNVLAGLKDREQTGCVQFNFRDALLASYCCLAPSSNITGFLHASDAISVVRDIDKFRSVLEAMNVLALDSARCGRQLPQLYIYYDNQLTVGQLGANVIEVPMSSYPREFSLTWQ